jgi:hypothetical protein
MVSCACNNLIGVAVGLPYGEVESYVWGILGCHFHEERTTLPCNGPYREIKISPNILPVSVLLPVVTAIYFDLTSTSHSGCTLLVSFI